MSDPEARSKLAELLRKGLAGRNYGGFRNALNLEYRRFGIDQISVAAFNDWCGGVTFPCSREKQDILADLVGGWCGEQIRNLDPPAFRKVRAIKAREGGDMAKRHTQERVFPTVRVQTDDGRETRQAVIVCIECNERKQHLRTGSMDDDVYFAKAGWQVGKNAEGDKCPSCRKVIRMKDQRPEKTPARPAPTMQELALLSMTIAENFDEAGKAYNAGWSDQRVAEDTGEPIELVAKKRLEMCPGSVGDDLAANEFVQGLAAVQDKVTSYQKKQGELIASVAAINTNWPEIAEQHRKLNLDSNAVQEQGREIETIFKRLYAIAEKIKFKKAG